MSLITGKTHIWRTAGLLLLILALSGPWTYEGVYIPPESTCTWPNSQPAGHPYCGLADAGLWQIVFSFMFTAALFGDDLNLNQWVAQATLPLLLTLSIAVLALLLLIRRDARPLPFALAWSLAAIAGMGYLYRGYYKPYALPGGNLLFIAVALTALTLELLLLARRTLPTPPAPPPGRSPHPGESPRLNP